MSNAFSGGGNNLPSYQRDRGEIWAEIRKLWRGVGAANDNQQGRVSEVAWSYGGVVKPAVDTFGQRWPAPTNGVLSTIHLTLAEASTLPIVVTTFLSGEPVSIDTLVAGSTSYKSTLFKRFTTDQEIYPRINATSTGTGTSLAIIYRYEQA